MCQECDINVTDKGRITNKDYRGTFWGIYGTLS